MSGYDETNPEAYRPSEPEAAADGAHSGVDSWSASSQASPATASSVSEGASVTEDHGGYADLSQAYTADELSRRGVAIEPMTCPPNAFNSGEDLIALKVGQTHSFTYRLHEED